MRTLLPFITLLFTLLSIDTFSQVVSTIWDSNVERITDAVIFDDQGNLYGADYNGQSIYVLSPSGDMSTFASGMNTPNGLAFDSENNLFVCDNVANRIYKINSDGVFVDTILTNNPSGIIKMLESDTMIFTSYLGNALRKLAPDGVIVETHQGGDLVGPVGLAFDDEGILLVGNYTNRKIYSVNGPDLTYIATVPGPSAGALGFIAFGGGYIWGTSFQGHEIYQIERSEIDSFTLYSGSVQGNMDGPISEATFSSPNGIITNAAADSIYVSQYPTGEIRLISPSLVGITEFKAPDVSIYPNPTKDILSIQTSAVIKRVEVMDILGNIVLEMNSNASTLNKGIDVSSLQRGVFFVRLFGTNNESIEKRFVKL